MTDKPEEGQPPADGGKLPDFETRLKAAIELLKRDYADVTPEEWAAVNAGREVVMRVTNLSIGDGRCEQLAADYDRIEALGTAIENLPDDEARRKALRAAIGKFRFQILARPAGSVAGDLELLKKFTTERGQP